MRSRDVFRRTRRHALPWLLSLALAAPALADSAPDWLRVLSAAPSPTTQPAPHAYRLLHSHFVRCAAKGRNVIVDRGAIRILDKQALDAARVAVAYDRGSARVQSIRAWLVGTDGKVKEFGDGDAVDVSLADWGSLKSDERARGIVAAGATPGATFGWEWTLEEEPLFADHAFVFGDQYPTALELIELDLPSGVEPRVIAFDNDVPEPTRTDNAWRWEWHNLPALASEGASATGASWRHVFVASPSAARGAPTTPGQKFASWADVSRWLAQVSAESAAPSPSIVAAAAAGAGSTPLERARSLGRSVQSTNYVSVSVGLARGEGYRPHPATDVLKAGFGDCKDKANLFCALARSIGFQAWLVSATTEGRDHVRPEWPSPGQFDHCIAALGVPAGSGLSSVVESTPFGALLFFDPTDPYTPMGELPEGLQGSWGLIEAAEHGELLRLPTADPRRSGSRWTFRARIDSSGALAGTWEGVLRGGAAAAERSQWTLGDAANRGRYEHALADWLGGCRVEGFHTEDLSDQVRLTLGVRVDRFGRRMGESMLAFRTAPAAPAFAWESPDTIRHTPVALPARTRVDSIVVELPAGWRVDELPEPVSQERDFGAFRARWAVAGETLVATLETRLEPATLPPARYRELLAFSDAVRRARRTQVVLVQR